jgi:putative phosphoesterase
MLIGIMSDSHDNRPAVRRAAALFKEAGCGLVVHAGDFVAPFAARELEKAGCPIKAVYGNCDGEKAGLEATLAAFGTIEEAPSLFEFAGLKFLITHLDAPVSKYIKEKEYDVIIYGHTHKPEVRKAGKTLVINPGEAGGWVTGRSTIALLDAETITAEIIAL